MSADIYDFQQKRKTASAKVKAPPPWFRFFAQEWLTQTRSLTAAEFGILIRLIAEMHVRGEPIPEDHARLARLCVTVTINFRHALEGLLADGLIVRRGRGLWAPAMDDEAEFRRVGNARRSESISGGNSIKSMPENDRVLESQSNRDSEALEGALKERHSSESRQEPSSTSEDRRSTRSRGVKPAPRVTYQQGEEINIDGYGICTVEVERGESIGIRTPDGTYRTIYRNAEGEIDRNTTFDDDCPF